MNLNLRLDLVSTVSMPNLSHMFFRNYSDKKRLEKKLLRIQTSNDSYELCSNTAKQFWSRVGGSASKPNVKNSVSIPRNACVACET